MAASENLSVWRKGQDSFMRVGTIDRDGGTFSYSSSYLSEPAAFQLSFSLPLREEPFAEAAFRPYFEGLLPEGLPRLEKAARLGLRQTDYLSLLGASGFDCIGDVAIGPADKAPEPDDARLEPIELKDLLDLKLKDRPIEEVNDGARLSLAGTQDKAGLFHDESQDLDHGWFLPQGGASSTCIVKAEALNGLSCLEKICMSAASDCGIQVARTGMPDSTDAFICSKRYDRIDDGTGNVARLHQEDLCQALGILPSDKYVQLRPSTLYALGDFLRTHMARPLDALSQFVKLTCFNYAIGNCDNHLKNFALLYSEDGSAVSLAPAYDLVSTTFFPRFSTRMGISLDDASDIADVTPANIVSAASALGLGRRAVEDACEEIARTIVPAIERSASALEAHHPAATSIAWDLEEDMAPRIAVLQSV